jgi:hypothetical protein
MYIPLPQRGFRPGSAGHFRSYEVFMDLGDSGLAGGGPGEGGECFEHRSAPVHARQRCDCAPPSHERASQRGNPRAGGPGRRPRDQRTSEQRAAARTSSARWSPPCDLGPRRGHAGGHCQRRRSGDAAAPGPRFPVLAGGPGPVHREPSLPTLGGPHRGRRNHGVGGSPGARWQWPPRREHRGRNGA